MNPGDMIEKLIYGAIIGFVVIGAVALFFSEIVYGKKPSEENLKEARRLAEEKEKAKEAEREKAEKEAEEKDKKAREQ